MRKDPPRMAQRFFSWYCRNRLHDSILGDLNEQFLQNQKKYGSKKAQLMYWLGVLRFVNRFTLKKDKHASYNYFSTSMIKNNLISSLRFFGRNKGFTSINILGLTLGLSSFLLILFFVNHELSFDEFHKNSTNVFRVNFSYQDNSGNVTTLVNSPPALATGVWGKFPELEKISKMRYAMNSLFENGDIRFYEDHGYYADSLFLEILQFEMTSGDSKTALDEPNSIVISEELALKYFDKTDPLGATLMYNNSIPLKITGILSNLPTNSHLDFDFLISFSTYTVPAGYASDLTSWSWLGFLTYVELKPNSDPQLFEEKLAQHFRELNPDNPNPMLPIAQNLSEIYLGSSRMSDDLASHIRFGNSFSVKALMTVAILILIIAGFNFSNLTNALSLNRSKATGIRKVLGAQRRSILIQMLTEALILTFICLILSFGIVLLIFPSISSFMGWEFTPGFDEILRTAPVMILVSIVVGAMSGLYPAITLAKFDIIKSLKGTLKVGSKSQFQVKNVLVIIQFAISIGLITTTIIMTQQINYLRNQETGYNAENVILIKMLPEDMSRYYEVYKEQMVKYSSVISISRSERVVGDPWPFSSIQRIDQDPETSKRIFFNLADYDYFETMGIPLYNGRSFSKRYVNDPTRSIIINQQAANYLGLDDPIGEQVHFFELDGPRTIIGVVENFNYTSLHQEIGPAAVILPFIDLEHMYVRFTPGDLDKHIELLEDTWDLIAEGTPLEWRFLDDNLDQLYRSEEKLSSMIQVFTALAISLACLGLYGIITFMVNNRIKEVGVRKVLGASVKSLYLLFIRTYIYQVLLAMLIILPLIHYLLIRWLQDFAYHIKINWTIYPLAAILLIFLILITVSNQIMRAAKLNPTLLLRDE